MGPAEIRVELLVIGGGPAGCAAAITAARRGLRVGLVVAPPRDSVCLGWVSPSAVQLAGELGVEAGATAAAPWRGVHLYTWDFKKSVEIDEEELAGWIVPRSGFDQALQRAARHAGATLISGRARELTLAEESVRVAADNDTRLSGQLAILADGAGSAMARQAGLLPARLLDPHVRCARAVIPQGAARPGIDLVLGPGRGQPVALLVRGPTEVRAWLRTRDASQPPTEQLGQLLSAASAAGVVASHPPALMEETLAVAGAALDLDQHVGKRCLLVGDAGGFVAALSNEGLYPGMKSGQVAAEVAADALAAQVPQDVLAGFGAAWRAALAGYLRLPNSDLGLLLPLVFNNPQMSRRVARAFLLGETF